MGLTAVACNSQTAAEGDAQGAEKVMTAKDYLPSRAEIDSVSYLMGINFGGFLKSYNFGDLNYNEVVKGIKDFMNAEGDPRSADLVKQIKDDPNSMPSIPSPRRGTTTLPLRARRNPTNSLPQTPRRQVLP